MDENQLAFAKALADETRQEIMSHLCCVWLNQEQVTVCCGLLVRNFAPDYADKLVGPDDIPGGE